MIMEKALLIGASLRRREAMESLEELAELARSAGAEVIGRKLFLLRQIQPATFVGEGHLKEILEVLERESVDLVIFDEGLSPTQNRNLEELWRTKVIDRTGLILDIFARRARTREGKLQVEMAQLSYLLPRFVGKGVELSRLGGGIGTRGPGETKLEIDRRHAKEKLHRLSQELKKLKCQREIHRHERKKGPIPVVSLVGYTNAGKSALMNRLTGASVEIEDKLFATLDPTVRRLRLPSGLEILISDTVGFIRKLPHELVESFQATFAEIQSSDLLLHIVDIGNPSWKEQKKAVEEVLEKLGLGSKPQLLVYNKSDLKEPTDSDGLSISALKGKGIASLLEAIETRICEKLIKTSFLFPHNVGQFLPLLYSHGRVLSVKHLKKGVHIVAEVDEKYTKQLAAYRAH